jgi:hypothetical protein
LLALLALLIVEARGVAEQAVAQRAGTLDPTHAKRVPAPLIVLIMLAVTAGDVVAFRVLWSGHASGWETVVVWTALAIGLASVLLSGLVVFVGVTGRPAWTRQLGILRRWAPFVLGAIAGLVASPLALGTKTAGARFAVYGTCLSGGCGLKQRSGPGRDFRTVDGSKRFNDGTLLLVACQTAGLPAPRVRSHVWDRLPNGHFVSDAFVNTPNRSGGFSEELPRC